MWAMTLIWIENLVCDEKNVAWEATISWILKALSNVGQRQN